ncbi:bifunctional 1-(5-phosphoribosyl)-5-((5-phosphoribosylamino)methylideneamino)imidazole-4-carboxamide isomerase/phosphoribosylanthranilate isomerase PriA [Acidipropionibacterium virtanenii]|uniref:1-(5-phosphoribosyl)-5-[(5-phosphoribosylamino)methylideneamino] imidazole-4-carboxamide isomerase n=1 Tax=Acidipropionibacterium virtanenii TaxID=2057246 RepID=A0A344UU19_9ACTN|nr:bifunctional 1-(5-phosphoribosyl)-5-((5-phosphoribosylamino)methylideneamino)imidazole-4-carboxamide isomerase/phosphoribosylanthranilate isomerase PriA [Acidipropionibacterium virtanenii]AXE38767.1 1-(5-phosphoribosyl)-5-[(5-phosphoribosylamino)methylideneamino] imidazole-4-carboxamide isomerase [Acidipropionibacterium virtanenii]
MTEELVLLPAVDIQNGRAVQLQQGVAGSEKVFGDPLEAARRWQEQGARWIHLVDLDAAFGRGSNTDLLRRIVGELDVDVEVSGGIRDSASLDAALAAGARRVNIGTAALENPTWCDEVVGEYGDRVAIGLDVRGDRLAARGWTREGGMLLDVLARLEEAGCRRYVVTDVASDGMLTGPNYELLGQVCARTQGHVVASGGISTLEDLRRLRGLVPIGVEGAIVGTALYVGSFTLPDALEICHESVVPAISADL